MGRYDTFNRPNGSRSPWPDSARMGNTTGKPVGTPWSFRPVGSPVHWCINGSSSMLRFDPAISGILCQLKNFPSPSPNAGSCRTLTPWPWMAPHKTRESLRPAGGDAMGMGRNGSIGAPLGHQNRWDRLAVVPPKSVAFVFLLFCNDKRARQACRCWLRSQLDASETIRNGLYLDPRATSSQSKSRVASGGIGPTPCAP